MEDKEEGRDIELGLGLGLGVGEFLQKSNQQKGKPAVGLDLTLLLNPKEERESPTAESKEYEYEHERKRSSSDFRNGDNEYIKRKKLRLTKEQSNSLEQSFKLHATLNPAQKQELADQLNLLPRQIEVWFQNRRARTKLKQTEIDCEFLRKWCESLRDENLRLKRELQVLKLEESPLQLTKKGSTTLRMCSSCERIMKTKAKPVIDSV